MILNFNLSNLFTFKLTGAEKLLICNKPTKCTKLTMKFQKFSPNPKGFIFIPGESYYLMGWLLQKYRNNLFRVWHLNFFRLEFVLK